MAQAVAERQSMNVRPDGVVELTMRVILVDAGSSMYEETDATATFGVTAETYQISDAICNAIRGRASELGFTLNTGDILHPTFTRA